VLTRDNYIKGLSMLRHCPIVYITRKGIEGRNECWLGIRSTNYAYKKYRKDDAQFIYGGVIIIRKKNVGIIDTAIS